MEVTTTFKPADRAAWRPVWLFNSGTPGEGNGAEEAGDLDFPKALQTIVDCIKVGDSAIDLGKLNRPVLRGWQSEFPMPGCGFSSTAVTRHSAQKRLVFARCWQSHLPSNDQQGL